MNDNIVHLAKRSHKLKLHPFLFLVFHFPSLILIVVRLKLFYLHRVCKQKGLDSKVDNVTTTTNPLMLYIPFNLLLIPHIILYCFAKSIIWASIISNNSSKLLYDTIIFKD